jgi:hypothetical protein
METHTTVTIFWRACFGVGSILAAIALNVGDAQAAQGCVMRNCNGSADCESARKSFDACVKADSRMRRIEAESKRNAELAKPKQEIEALRKIEEANKKVQRTQGPN